MPPSRRYEEYPQLARLVRAMSDEGRELVAHWHRVLTTALEGYAATVGKVVAEAYADSRDKSIAQWGSEKSAREWLRVMRSVAELVDEGGAGDWCCKPGMLASPDPCPQHGFNRRRDYELGTIISRPYGCLPKEHAVCVRQGSGKAWHSIEFPLIYNAHELSLGNWTVVGRV